MGEVTALGKRTTRFPRPVRWMLALHGTDVIPVQFAGLTAGRHTLGHRFLVQEPSSFLERSSIAPRWTKARWRSISKLAPRC